MSDSQRDLLCDGESFLDLNGPGFDTPELARAAWRRHKAELMESCGPGERPYAFFEFELGCSEAYRWGWSEKLGALLDRNLIDTTEAQAIEQERPLLARLQLPNLYDSYNSLDGISMTHSSLASLRETLNELTFAVRWHTWRGHAELAAKYDHLAATIRQAQEQVA